jgi:hypothetical protein
MRGWGSKALLWLDRAGRDRPWTCALVLFALAFGVRVAAILLLRTYRNALSPEPILVAKSLVREHLFGNPFGVPTGPTAVVPPGPPFLLSLLYSWFGDTTATKVARQVLSAAACSVEYALLPALAAAAGLRRAVGILAGGAGALVPLFFWIETNGSWESSYIAAMLVAMLILSARLWAGVRVSPFVYGAAWGFVFLFAPGFLFVFLALLGVWWWRSRNTRAVLTAGALAFAVVLPWIVRNYLQLGSVFWMRDGFGIELQLSNNPIARPMYYDAQAFFPDHPYDNRAEALRLGRIGEVEYFHQRGVLGQQWIRSHPRRFAELTAARAWYFWFPRFRRLSSTLLAAAVSLGGLVGLALAIRLKRRLAASLFGLVWLVYPLPYYLVLIDPRYRYPIYSQALLLIAFLVVSSFERWAPNHAA